MYRVSFAQQECLQPRNLREKKKHRDTDLEMLPDGALGKTDHKRIFEAFHGDGWTGTRP